MQRASSHESKSDPETGELGHAIIAGALIFLFVAVAAATELVRAGPSFYRDPGANGVRLGMSEAEVRAGFVDGRSGQWVETPACTTGVGLEWHRIDHSVPITWARFEFHDGILVAMRLHSEDPDSTRIDVGPLSIRRRVPFEGGSATTILSTACEEIRPEADAIVAAKGR